MAVEGPPADHLRRTDFQCTTSRGVPVVDTAFAGVFGVVAGGVAWNVVGTSSTHQSDQWVAALILGVPAVLFAASGYVGFVDAADCRDALDALAQRQTRAAAPAAPRSTPQVPAPPPPAAVAPIDNAPVPDAPVLLFPEPSIELAPAAPATPPATEDP